MQQQAATPAGPGNDPRSDAIGGLCWLGLGAVILGLSWRMDRLQDQDINPYTIPGLVPGLLGLAMIALASVMLARFWRSGGMGVATNPDPKLDWRRLGLVLLLCLGFAAGLLGRMPFAAAAAVFVTASIVALRWQQIREHTLRLCLAAATIGVGTGLAVSFVFGHLFLVRLP